jgi:hypothetical protein
MPLNPPEDEDDTVVNIIYPLEPPVSFIQCIFYQLPKKSRHISYLACYVLWRGLNY